MKTYSLLLSGLLLLGCTSEPQPEPETQAPTTEPQQYKKTSSTQCYRLENGSVAHDLSVNQLEATCPCGMKDEWPEAYQGKFGGTLKKEGE